MGCLRAVVMALSRGKGLRLVPGLRMANDRDDLRALLLDELGKGHAAQEAVHRDVQVLPELVRHAALAFLAILAAATRGRIDRLLDRADDVRDREAIGRACQL